MRAALPLLALLALAPPALAQPAEAPRIGVRTGVHHGFTRIVFDWPRAVRYSVTQQGEAVEIRFEQPARPDLAALARPLRNLRAAERMADGVLLALRPGVQARHLTVGNLVVIDLVDPGARYTVAEARLPDVPPPPEVVAPRAPPAPVVAPPPPPAAPAALRLPFRGAAAAFRRGEALILLFEEAAELDAALLPHAKPLDVSGAAALLLPGEARALRREDGHWVLAEAAPVAPLPVARDAEGPRLVLRAEGAGRVIALPDPLTDGLLLVGTLDGAPRGVAAGQRFVGFDLLPTQLGVALALRSDEVVMRRTAEGFVVPLGVSASAPGADLGAGAAIPRLLWLHEMPLARLMARWADLQARIAAAPAQARGPLRMELAEALLALGLGLEAQAAVAVAVADDPRLLGRPHTQLLSGAVALLAGRMEDAREALADPRLPAEGEAALWRGLADATPPAGFRAAAPLARSYPAPLRRRVLPMLALALIEGGAVPEAAALMEGAPLETPLARFVAARLAEARGEATAREAYAALAEGRDADARARALARLAELRVAEGPAIAAEAMERAAAAWRGDARELALRLRAAELRLAAAQPRQALALLRETEALFPEAGAALRERLGAAVTGVIADAATPPHEAARLHAEHLGALPADPALDAALARVAERLMALELPGDAAALLRRALDRSTDRAGLSLRLAEARLAEGDAAAALDALRGGAALAGEAGLRRALAEATARQRLGDIAGAAGVLRGLGPEGAPRLVELLAGAGDWPGAAEALAALLPAEGPLSAEGRRDALRLASFRTLADDGAGLARLAEQFGPRMRGGDFAEAFATLTTQGGDARQEIARARALANELRALR